LLNIVENIDQGFEDGQETAMVFLDVSPAFDRVWQNGLLYKLEKIGIGAWRTA